MTTSLSVKLEMTPDFKAMYDYVVSFLNPIAEASLEMHDCVGLLGWDSDVCAPHIQSWDRSMAILKQRRAELSEPE